MPFFMRLFRIFILLALILIPAALSAQDAGEPVTVIGSGIVQPLFEALAAGSDVNLSVSVTGTTTGFNRFCAGEADITLANREMTFLEVDACRNNEVEHIDLLLGHDVIAVIANPALDFAFCLDEIELNTLFAPSAQSDVTNWNQVIADAPDTPLSFYIPSGITAEYAILDRVIEGDGIRGDVTTLNNADEIIAAVSEDSSAVGVVRLGTAEAAGDAVTILDLDAGNIPGCRPPSAENVEDNLYPAADKLYAYVNIASLDKDGLANLLEAISGDDAPGIVSEQGFIAPTGFAYQTNLSLVQAAVTGEPVIRTTDDFIPPVGLVGDVLIGGAAGGFAYMQDAAATFNQLNPGVTVDILIEGEPAGFRRLCNGEIDMAIAYRDLNADEAANCEANNISRLNIGLGSQAVVLVANAETEYLSCMTGDDIAAAWAAESGGSITTWDQVNAAFDDTAITLFAPALGDAYADLLLIQAAGRPLAIRADLYENNDPLYRAAATANVTGSLTYMDWYSYQRVTANNQANITLVSVDSGAGCVAPSAETIGSGAYSLARPMQLIINSDMLANPEVQAFLWSLVSTENYPLLEDSGFVGLRLSDLADLRTTLRAAFTEAEAAREAELSAEITPEVTEEPVEETEPEAEVTEEAEATEEAEEAADED